MGFENNKPLGQLDEDVMKSMGMRQLEGLSSGDCLFGARAPYIYVYAPDVVGV